MGNQGSSELDGTIRRIEDLKNKPAQLKVELIKFVQQVPLDHTYEMKVDKKLVDILMNLIKAELSIPNCPDIHIMMMTIQRLLKVKGFYLAIPKCNITPLILALQHKDPGVVLSTLNAVAWLLDCRCNGASDKKFEKDLAELQAKQAFYESKGYEILINRVLLTFSKTKQYGVVSKVVDILALDLVDHCMTTRFIGIQKLLQLLSPHIDLLLSLTTHQDLNTRCYSSILLQGYLLHSPLHVTQNLQSKVLEEGHLLHYILYCVDGTALPSNHPYIAQGMFDKNLTELSRNLLGLLCAGNPTIVEICVQKTIPKPLQINLEALNADNKTNVSLSSTGSKSPKDTLKNTLWNNFQSNRMKRVNIHPQFARLDTEVREPHILWTLATKAELCIGLLKEIEELKSMKEFKETVRWDYDGFQIEYKSLDRYLRVGGYYISLLLPQIQDKNSSYLIEIDQIHILIALLFGRSVIEDEPGWKLACLRTLSALYDKYTDQVSKDLLEILPYFTWLIDPKHTLPIYRDHLLKLMSTLLKNEEMVKKFVKQNGINHLLYYISRVLTLPDTPLPGTKGADKKKLLKKKKRTVDSDEEDEDEEKDGEGKGMNGSASSSSSSSNAAGGSGDKDSDEKSDENSRKQNLLVGLPAPMGIPETAITCLNLLKLIQNSGPKMKRVMSEKDVINTLTRLLMCPNAGIKEDGIKLLLEILDGATHIVPRLAGTGCFSFMVYGMRNGLSPAVLELLGKYHMKQSVSLVPAGESALSPYFPRALTEVLKIQGAEAFGQLFDARDAGAAAASGVPGSIGSDLIWNLGLKKHLFEVMSRRLGSFRALLEKDPFAEYKFSPPESIRYPSLESELNMAGVSLRALNETGGGPHMLEQIHIENPEQLFNELITSLVARRYAGIDLLNILTAQVILIKSFPTLPEVSVYPHDSWEALFEITNNHVLESDFLMIEKSLEIIHVLLSVKKTNERNNNGELEEDDNVNSFIELKGLPLLTKTLEYFSSLKINNILIQRILINLLYVVYDLGLKAPDVVAKDFGSNKKFLRKNLLEFLGKKSSADHPVLSVATCRALMSLSLNERFQIILIETGTLLHLVDMAVFYASNSIVPRGGDKPGGGSGMDEEKRVRLAAVSVLSLLDGFATPHIAPEPNPQVQRVLHALLTPNLSKLLVSPSGFLGKITELRPGMSGLYKYLEAELLALQKNNGEWNQKSWPFQPIFTLKTAPAARGSASAASAAAAPSSAFRTPQTNGRLSQVQAAAAVEYDEDGQELPPPDNEEQNMDDGSNGMDGDPNMEDDMPDAYAIQPQRRLMTPGDRISEKMDSISSSIGGAFASLKSKATQAMTPAKMAETKAAATASATRVKSAAVEQASAVKPAVSNNEQVKRVAASANVAAQRVAANPTVIAARTAAAPVVAQGKQVAAEMKQDLTSAGKKIAIDARRTGEQAAVEAKKIQAQMAPQIDEARAKAAPKVIQAKSALSSFGASIAAGAAGALAATKAVVSGKPPVVKQPQPPAAVHVPDEEEVDDDVEQMDSSSFYNSSGTHHDDHADEPMDEEEEEHHQSPPAQAAAAAASSASSEQNYDDLQGNGDAEYTDQSEYVDPNSGNGAGGDLNGGADTGDDGYGQSNEEYVDPNAAAAAADGQQQYDDQQQPADGQQYEEQPQDEEEVAQ